MMNGWILVTESVKAFTEQKERCCQFFSVESLVVALPHKPEAVAAEGESRRKALLLLQKFDHVRLTEREMEQIKAGKSNSVIGRSVAM